MDGFTIVDGIALVVVVISTLLAFSRGFVREVLSIIGWGLAAIAAYIFAPTVEPLVSGLPYVSDILVGNCELSMVVAFALAGIVALVIIALLTPLISGAVQNSAIGPIDQGFGALFGVARGILLVSVALLLFNMAPANDMTSEVANSESIGLFGSVQDWMLMQFENQDWVDWIGGKYNDLIATCPAA
ncbi:CvpA family protein [Paracoccaceae bacterium GXU_MW_L88]